jgi:transposase
MTQQQSHNSQNYEEFSSNIGINLKKKEELEARFKRRDEQRKQALSEKENQTENCFSDQLQSIKNFDSQFSMYKQGIVFFAFIYNSQNKKLIDNSFLLERD